MIAGAFMEQGHIGAYDDVPGRVRHRAKDGARRGLAAEIACGEEHEDCDGEVTREAKGKRHAIAPVRLIFEPWPKLMWCVSQPSHDVNRRRSVALTPWSEQNSLESGRSMRHARF